MFNRPTISPGLSLNLQPGVDISLARYWRERWLLCQQYHSEAFWKGMDTPAADPTFHSAQAALANDTAQMFGNCEALARKLRSN